jgi:hypothetical protein
MEGGPGRRKGGVLFQGDDATSAKLKQQGDHHIVHFLSAALPAKTCRRSKDRIHVNSIVVAGYRRVGGHVFHREATLQLCIHPNSHEAEGWSPVRYRTSYYGTACHTRSHAIIQFQSGAEARRRAPRARGSGGSQRLAPGSPRRVATTASIVWVESPTISSACLASWT